MAIIYHVTDLTSDGRGVARRDDGRVVFIEGALPGDAVLIDLQEEVDKGPLLGKVNSIIVSSPFRHEHPCKHYAEGCPASLLGAYQYEKALEWKRSHLLESFIRMGYDAETDNDTKREKLEGIIQKTIASPLSWNYRDRIELKLEKIKNKHKLVYQTHGNVIPVNNCLLAVESIQKILSQISEFLNNNNFTPDPSFWRRQMRIMLRDNGQGGVVAILFVITTRNFKPQLYAEFMGNFKDLAGFRIMASKSVNSRLFASKMMHESGDCTVTHKIGDFEIQADPTAFSQANHSAAEVLTEKILSEIKPEFNLLDLYGGYGAFGFAHIQRGEGKATVVESSSDALATGWKFARDKKQKIEFVQQDLDRQWPRNLKLKNFNAAILDPPRKGASRHVIRELNMYGPRKIIYVSCHQAALIRDLKKFDRYNLKDVVPVDLFPRTPELEVIAVLDRK